MNQILKEKIREALTSVLPITLIVIVLSTTVTPIPIGTMMLFLEGAALLIVGMGIFSLGADIAMMPMGEGIASSMTKTKKIPLIVLVFLVMGIIITIAEPDLQVLARQTPSIPAFTLIITVAIGVGFFLVVAAFRTLFRITLSKLLFIFYIGVFILAAFVPRDFIPVAFDSGGVTTGPITVPFIMAMGLGIASLRGDHGSQEDSFGMVALCSIGPILAVLLLGMIYHPSGIDEHGFIIPRVLTMQDVSAQFAYGLPEYLKEVVLAVLPIVVVFAIFQAVYKHFSQRSLIRVAIGLGYTTIGLILFLTGANVGFMPAGQAIGAMLGGSGYNWLLIPIGMLIGYFIVAAEPAVHVLNKQVEEISAGAIPQKYMQISLSVGVALSVGLSMLRVLTGISIFWMLVPGYAIALTLSFFVPKIFTGVAFDSGGVASGPMTATFLLPFTMGACDAVGGNVMTQAFGIVAMVAMTPLITIQMLGLIYMLKEKAAAKAEAQAIAKAKAAVALALEREAPASAEDEFILFEEEDGVDD
ncbi:MAG: DUF1538 domain-containing protein [Clostridiales bacterium]|nr:DUF1538 domain-containing protein [Clostridiales bacterium]